MVGGNTGMWINRGNYYAFLTCYSPDPGLGALPVATHTSCPTLGAVVSVISALQGKGEQAHGC